MMQATPQPHSPLSYFLLFVALRAQLHLLRPLLHKDDPVTEPFSHSRSLSLEPKATRKFPDFRVLLIVSRETQISQSSTVQHMLKGVVNGDTG